MSTKCILDVTAQTVRPSTNQLIISQALKMSNHCRFCNYLKWNYKPLKIRKEIQCFWFWSLPVVFKYKIQKLSTTRMEAIPVFSLLTGTIFDRGFYEIICGSAKTSSLYCVSCDKWKILLCSCWMIRKAQVSIYRIKTEKCQGHSLKWEGAKLNNFNIPMMELYRLFWYIKGFTLLKKVKHY